MFALGLLTGPATEPAYSGVQAIETRRRVSPVLRIAVATVASGLIVAETIPLLASMEVRKSQESVNSGELVQALDHAESARSIQPWAATPYLQIALVQELGGQIDEAHTSIEHALENDRSDWRLWLVAARIQTKAGDIAAARQSLAKARELNPKSQLFAG
jgi:tetratricopeptide (TPR) repeat protein